MNRLFAVRAVHLSYCDMFYINMKVLKVKIRKSKGTYTFYTSEYETRTINFLYLNGFLIKIIDVKILLQNISSNFVIPCIFKF